MKITNIDFLKYNYDTLLLCSETCKVYTKEDIKHNGDNFPRSKPLTFIDGYS